MNYTMDEIKRLQEQNEFLRGFLGSLEDIRAGRIERWK